VIERCLNNYAVPSYLPRGSAAMVEKSREEIEKKLEQSRRLAGEGIDPTTKARLKQFVRDLEAQLREMK
jgi:hypothetical protein